MTIQFAWAALIATLSVSAQAQSPGASDRISIVGSSTVYPFSTLVAEHFAKSGSFSAPVVRSASTAEGFKLFCAGAGAGTPDISNASRPITDAERATCIHNGVLKIAEIRIGYDSLILASSIKAGALEVSLDQLWRAAAELVPVGGQWVPNPYHQWHDIDPSLPARPINLIGPGPGHGTRDAFIELVMEPRCRAALPQRADTGHQNCTTIRRDGIWTDSAELELILGKLASNPEAFGILTYSYLDQFRNRIQAATIDGIMPSLATISSGKYSLSRPLFIYVKEAHLKTTLGLADFAAEFLSLCAAGMHGYLADEGLVPLPTPELLGQRAAVARLER